MIRHECIRRPHRLPTRMILAACFLLGASISEAQEPERPLVRASVMVMAQDRTGPFDALLRFEIEPEWYLYWVNPGDAGLPVEARWRLPEGWVAGPLRFPTPEKIVKGGVTAFGYHDELVVLCRITPGAGQEVGGTLRVDLDWLVCEESCLPGRARLELDLNPPKLRSAVVDPGRAEEYAARFPLALGTLGLSVGAIELERSGGTWFATIPLVGPDAESITDFYPEPVEGFTADLSEIRILHNRIRIRLQPETESSVLRSLRGLAIAGGRGYELEAFVASPER